LTVCKDFIGKPAPDLRAMRCLSDRMCRVPGRTDLRALLGRVLHRDDGEAVMPAILNPPGSGRQQ
jgi:hypothetical protein